MPHPKAHTSVPIALQGKVVGLNISPRGDIEGAMLETMAGLAQVNFPRETAEALAGSMKVGRTVDLRATLESDEPRHPVYRASAEEGEVSGTIVSLNYALHGEVNGYVLGNGTFLHLKPEGVKRHTFDIGDAVTASGARRAGLAALVIEVRNIVGTGKHHEETARA